MMVDMHGRVCDGVDNDCDGSTGETAEGGTCQISDIGLEDANVMFTGSTASDVAGSAVHLLPDIDGDGVADVAIGAPYEDTGGSAAGAVYVPPAWTLDWIARNLGFGQYQQLYGLWRRSI